MTAVTCQFRVGSGYWRNTGYPAFCLEVLSAKAGTWTPRGRFLLPLPEEVPDTMIRRLETYGVSHGAL